MKISLSKEDLLSYVISQLTNNFPDNQTIESQLLQKNLDTALQRTEHCFSKVNNKYFRDNSNAIFNHLNGDQYSMFLYFFNNTIYKNTPEPVLCSKIFLLNKYLHGIDIFYEVELPDIFLFTHPLGTVLGRAKYSNYLLVYQQCNVGSNKGIYPVLNENVNLHPGSSVLGNCRVGKNSKVAAYSLLLDMDLEANSLYIGNPRDYIIKKTEGIDPIWDTGGN